MELKLTEFREISELCEALLSMAADEDRGGPRRKALESAAALIAYQAGQLSAVNKRLEGDMSEIPDAALMALVRLVIPTLNNEQALASRAMKVARRTRTLCFFQVFKPEPEDTE